MEDGHPVATPGFAPPLHGWDARPTPPAWLTRWGCIRPLRPVRCRRGAAIPRTVAIRRAGIAAASGGAHAGGSSPYCHRRITDTRRSRLPATTTGLDLSRRSLLPDGRPRWLTGTRRSDPPAPACRPGLSGPACRPWSRAAQRESLRSLCRLPRQPGRLFLTWMVLPAAEARSPSCLPMSCPLALTGRCDLPALGPRPPSIAPSGFGRGPL